jgi:uncharacterized protein
MRMGGLARAKRRGVLLDAATDGPARCRTCDGVCCRSFPTVELTAAEHERLARLGARRLESSLRGRHWLVIENGCEFLVAGACAIYPDRPDICRRFVCVDG